MKTPMQELLERVKEYRDSETDVIARSRLNSVCVDIVGMLEKEKEVMCGIYDDALARVDRNYIGGEGEQYFDDTFNTKENGNNNEKVL